MHLKIYFLFWAAPIDDVDVGSQMWCCVVVVVDVDVVVTVYCNNGKVLCCIWMDMCKGPSEHSALCSVSISLKNALSQHQSYPKR